MFTPTAILIVLAVAAISGFSGYFISGRFYRTDYAANDKSGDFGTTPRGGFFALMAGCFVGMLLVRFTAGFMPVEAVGPAFIGALIAGAVGGVVGMFSGQKSRSGTKPSDTPADTGEKKDEPKQDEPKN